MNSVSLSVSASGRAGAEQIGKSLRFFASLRLCGFFASFLFAQAAYAQTPYLGGKGDGYASQFTQISAVQQSIAPAWMRVYPSPVRSGEEIVVTVFDVKAEAHAELYDVLGKALGNQASQSGLGQLRLRLPTTDLARGVYLLRVVRDEDASTQKIIVW